MCIRDRSYHACTDINSLRSQRTTVLGERMVRDKIEDHVVLFPVAGEIFSRVINNSVRADGPHQFHIPRTANTGNLSAQRLCDLCRKRADASGSAIDQNFLARLQLCLVAKSLQRGEPGHRPVSYTHLTLPTSD